MPQIDALQKNKLAELQRDFDNHQHRGFDRSQRLALLDWRELARTELAVAATSMTLLNIPTRRFMKIFIQHGAKASNGNTLLRFNNDSGNNYSSISRENNTARTSASSIDLFDTLNNTTAWFFAIDIMNIFNAEKTIVSEGIQRITAASSSQITRQVYGTWVNTTEFINRIDIVSSGGNLPIGSQISVFGTNF